MRIAIAEIAQETCSFNPVPTKLEDFELGGLYFGDEILKKMRGVERIGGFIAAAEEESTYIEPLPLIRAWAMSGGKITEEALDYLKQSLTSELKKYLPVDGVFLSLHGAASSEKVDDLEGYLLSAVRDVVGDDIPLVVPLDHHANITRQMIDNADVMVGYQTQPHDFFETGYRAAKILFRLIKGKISPTLGWQKIPMIAPQDKFSTSEGPMKEWFDLAREIEKRTNVISVSTFPMQPWLDVEEAGWSATVYTDNDPILAKSLAAELANKAWELREQFWVSDRLSPEEAIRQAACAREGLVILSDTGDLVYGGAPGDSTCLLEEMLKQRVECNALLSIIDPDVIEKAIKAGLGSEITVLVGGKLDNVFSDPVQVKGRVTAISNGLELMIEKLGFCDQRRTVLIEAGGVKLVVCEEKLAAMNHPIMYTHLGLDLEKAKLIVLKTGNQFQFFTQWRKGLIRVDSPGMTQSDLRAFNWTKIPHPMYPLDMLPRWYAE